MRLVTCADFDLYEAGHQGACVTPSSDTTLPHILYNYQFLPEGGDPFFACHAHSAALRPVRAGARFALVLVRQALEASVVYLSIPHPAADYADICEPLAGDDSGSAFAD